MRKRSKYKPRNVYSNPMEYVKQSVATLSSHKALLDLQLKNHSAMAELTQGRASKRDVDTVISALNMAEAFCLRGHGADYVQEITNGLEALKAVCIRSIKAQRFVLRAFEMQAINLAMEVHNAQLEVVSLRDMERARDLVISVIKNKKANVINEQG